MFIVDYSTDYRGQDVKTQIRYQADDVIQFSADRSSEKNFEIHRINKYEKGVLYPYEFKINKGRIVLEQLPKEDK